ncbi:MAG: hypothetical protein C0401_03835 [Anaerolinea sp.]|nr:hypothetical protein [Anaerolinea sp.]
MKTIGFMLTGVLFLGLLTSCNLFTAVNPAPTLQPTSTIMVNPPEIPLPTAAPTLLIPPPTPAPTFTPRPVMLIKAEVAFDNYLLRTGPGRLFERVAMYDSSAFVNILGREAGDNWVLVQTQDNRAGWMNMVGLTFIGDIVTLPVFVVTNTQILHGHVYKTDKTPASDIKVSIKPVGDDNPNLQDNAFTNKNGEWYIYLPINSSGAWFVGPNGYSCNSNAVDNQTSCALIGNLPDGQTVTLPLTQNVSLEFSLK